MRIVFALLTFMLPILSVAQVYTIMADSEGKLLVPKPSEFAKKNNIVTSEVVCLRVDTTTPNITATDAEIKVLNEYGELIYYITTLYSDYETWHKNDDTVFWDKDCEIYYYVAGDKYASKGQCANPKQKHTVENSTTGKYSIATRERVKGNTNAMISAIEFFPNVANQEIRNMILNPRNTIIVSLKNANGHEKDRNEQRIWRPITPIYYRALPKE